MTMVCYSGCVDWVAEGISVVERVSGIVCVAVATVIEVEPWWGSLCTHQSPTTAIEVRAQRYGNGM